MVEVFFRGDKNRATWITGKEADDWVAYGVARWKAHSQLELKRKKGLVSRITGPDISLKMYPKEIGKAAEGKVPSVARVRFWGDTLIRIFPNLAPS